MAEIEYSAEADLLEWGQRLEGILFFSSGLVGGWSCKKRARGENRVGGDVWYREETSKQDSELGRGEDKILGLEGELEEDILFFLENREKQRGEGGKGRGAGERTREREVSRLVLLVLGRERRARSQAS